MLVGLRAVMAGMGFIVVGVGGVGVVVVLMVLMGVRLV